MENHEIGVNITQKKWITYTKILKQKNPNISHSNQICIND